MYGRSWNRVLRGWFLNKGQFSMINCENIPLLVYADLGIGKPQPLNPVGQSWFLWSFTSPWLSPCAHILSMAGCCHSIRVQLGGYHRDHKAHKVKDIYCLALFRKDSLISELNFQGWVGETAVKLKKKKLYELWLRKDMPEDSWRSSWRFGQPSVTGSSASVDSINWARKIVCVYGGEVVLFC